jgi:hypothetical protein
MHPLRTLYIPHSALLLSASLVSGAVLAATTPALVRNVDRPGGANHTTLSCADTGSGCTWKPPGPVPVPTPLLVVNFVSYKVRFSSATKVTSVAIFCGNPGGVDWLPLGNAADDGAGTTTISWGGPVTLVYNGGCTGGAAYDHTGPNALSFEMRVHGLFEAPFP